MASFVQYLRETSQEMKRVSWPSRGQLWESTIVVIVTVTLITIATFLVDKILDYFVKFIINLG